MFETFSKYKNEKKLSSAFFLEMKKKVVLDVILRLNDFALIANKGILRGMGNIGTHK